MKEAWDDCVEENEQQQVDFTKAADMALGQRLSMEDPKGLVIQGGGRTGAGSSEGTWEGQDLGGTIDFLS